MKNLIRSLACVALAVSAVTASADDATAALTEDELILQNAERANDEQKVFFTLPCCRRVTGAAEVMKPGAEAWEAVEEGRFYPLGSTYRTVGAASRLLVQFGLGCEVVAKGDSRFGTRPQPLGVKGRTVVLGGGELHVKMPRDLTNGLFSVAAPGFVARDLCGASIFRYQNLPDGDLADIRCESGSLAIGGRHFTVTGLKSTNELKIRTSQDQLVSELVGVSGDISVRLDQGLRQIPDIETQETRIEAQILVWNLSPETAVRIHRAVPAVGEKLSVTVMTFDASGALKNRCAFTEGRYELTTGEQGPTSEKEREEIAKQAAAAGAEGAAAVAAPPSEAEPPADEEDIFEL